MTDLTGHSMEPTIPNGTRVRIDFGPRVEANEGDVVVVTTRTGYMIHRVVACWHRGRTRYVLTRGDGRWMPDAPVPDSELVGLVREIEGPEGWAPPPGPPDERVPAWASKVMLSATRYLSLLHPNLVRLTIRGGGFVRRVLRRVAAAGTRF